MTKINENMNLVNVVIVSLAALPSACLMLVCCLVYSSTLTMEVMFLRNVC
jgi:hypothetical protein